MTCILSSCSYNYLKALLSVIIQPLDIVLASFISVCKCSVNIMAYDELVIAVELIYNGADK